MDSLELLRELRRAVEGLTAFYEVGRSLTSTLDPGEILSIILDRVGKTFRPAAWALFLSEDVGGELAVHLAVGEGAERLLGQRVALGEGVAGWVAQAGQPVLLEDVRGDARFVDRVDPARGTGPCSFMAVPLRTVGGTLGVIALAARAGEPYAPDDLRTLGGIADFAAIALSNARHFSRVRDLTLLDEHTSLFNARHLHRSLEVEISRAARYRRPVSLIFLDLDRFKSVNDAHGHEAGSALLKEVGDVMRRSLRVVDVPIRYGGDEFVVILPEASVEHARAAAERLRAALHGATFLHDRGLAVRVSASFGIATWPDDGQTGEDLLRAADGAMYRAKEAGRDGVVAAGGAVAPKTGDRDR